MLSLITLPTPTEVLASSGVWSTAFFTELLNIAYMIIGATVGVLVLTILISVVLRAIGRLRGGRRRGGGGRRRR